MIEKWRLWLKSAGSRRLLVALGLVGILLLGLSEVLGKRSMPSNDVSETGTTVSTSAVEQALEERITALIQAVEGVGSCRVMVTLENSAQQVYATNSVLSSERDGEEKYVENSDQTVLMVETEEGPVGLPVTEIQPTVKGVAVVCQGGDDPEVRDRVIQLVSTAFHISDRRVCVVKQQ